MDTIAVIKKRNFSLIKLVYDNSNHRVGQLLLGVDIIYCNPRIIQYILRTSIPQGPWIATLALTKGIQISLLSLRTEIKILRSIFHFNIF